MPPDLASLMLTPCASSAQRGDVGERVAVLVDVHGDWRAAPELGASGVALLQRLLDVLDPERLERGARLQRLVERPPLVDVDHEREIGHRADGANALDIEAIATSELELQPPEPRRRGRSAPRHVVGIPEPHRPRRRRALPGQAEQAVDGDAEKLALEVVKRCVERALRCVLSVHLAESRADLLEIERVVADEAPVLLHERERGRRGLGVALDRSCLAPTLVPVVADRHVDDVRPVLRLAADDERLGQLEADDLRAYLHAERAYSESVATYAATSAASWPETMPGGIAPCPEATTSATSSAVSPLPASAGPIPPDASAPWQPAQLAANTASPRVASPCTADSAAGAVGENGCHSASPKVAADTTRSSASGFGGAPHQNPNLTFVKYHRLEVSQSVVSTAASEPPSTGSTHGA